jgi:sugar-phosphatase
MTERMRCSAVLFDLDGVLVHSADSVRRSWKAWADAQRVPYEIVERAAHGRRTVDTIREVAPHLDAERAAAELEASQALDVVGVVAGRGAADLLASLRDGEWAVVTSGTRHLARARLAAGALPVPAVMVTAEDVAHGKPSPEGYLAAAERLGRRAADCVVVEDAPAGVEAAHAAGMRVIGLAGGRDDVAHALRRADARVDWCAQITFERDFEILTAVVEGIPASRDT